VKISVVGVGRVGSTVAYTLVMSSYASELLLVNRTHSVAEGEALDLRHASALVEVPVEVRAAKVAETAGSDLIIVTASVPLPGPGAARATMARGNCQLFEELIPPLAAASPNAVLLMVTNPVDAMTAVAWKLSGFPARRVIGTGTLIDSARFRSLLSREVGIHPDDIRAYILGEHGEHQVPALSLAQSGGEWIGGIDSAQALFRETVGLGYQVIQRKGHSNYAIALACRLIVEAIAHDSMRTLPISTRIEGYLGVEDVFLSVPAVVGRAGVVRTLHPELGPAEADAFRAAAQAVREALAELGYA
jgi:L-lactate dehydrogenase